MRSELTLNFWPNPSSILLENSLSNWESFNSKVKNVYPSESLLYVWINCKGGNYSFNNFFLNKKIYLKCSSHSFFNDMKVSQHVGMFNIFSLEFARKKYVKQICILSKFILQDFNRETISCSTRECFLCRNYSTLLSGHINFHKITCSSYIFKFKRLLVFVCLLEYESRLLRNRQFCFQLY